MAQVGGNAQSPRELRNDKNDTRKQPLDDENVAIRKSTRQNLNLRPHHLVFWEFYRSCKLLLTIPQRSITIDILWCKFDGVTIIREKFAKLGLGKRWLRQGWDGLGRGNAQEMIAKNKIKTNIFSYITGGYLSLLSKYVKGGLNNRLHGLTWVQFYRRLTTQLTHLCPDGYLRVYVPFIELVQTPVSASFGFWPPSVWTGFRPIFEKSNFLSGSGPECFWLCGTNFVHVRMCAVINQPSTHHLPSYHGWWWIPSNMATIYVMSSPIYHTFHHNYTHWYF